MLLNTTHTDCSCHSFLDCDQRVHRAEETTIQETRPPRLGMMDVELPMRVWQALVLLVVGFVTLKLPTINRYIRVW